MAILRVVIIFILTTISVFYSAKNAEAIENSELIRASMIEKIANFIEWPSLNEDHFSICAFDNTSLLTALETYYKNSFIGKKPIRLVTFNHFNTSSGCQILYLGIAESAKLENILKLIDDQPILIITEKKDDVSQGAHVDFFVEDNRLHLEVNRTALLKSNLKASYHLLGVARIVE